MAAESSKGIKQFKVPHVYAIIFALMVIFAVLHVIVPSGSYQRQEVNGREVTVAGTYEQRKRHIDEETGDEVDPDKASSMFFRLQRAVVYKRQLRSLHSS